MKRVAKFEKVSFEEYEKAIIEMLPSLEVDAKKAYEDLKMPCRATAHSAGYDFFTPFKITLEPNQTIKFPSGIRCLMQDDYFLAIFPRSGLGFKFRLQLDNTVGIIDADFATDEKVGHIIVKLTNRTNENKTLVLESGQGYAQGIFLPFALTVDDNASAVRDGGFGSTDNVLPPR